MICLVIGFFCFAFGYALARQRTLREIEGKLEELVVDAYNAGTSDFKNALIEWFKDIGGEDAEPIIKNLEEGYYKITKEDFYEK